jgi:hypothetical protein
MVEIVAVVARGKDCYRDDLAKIFELGALVCWVGCVRATGLRVSSWEVVAHRQ